MKRFTGLALILATALQIHPALANPTPAVVGQGAGATGAALSAPKPAMTDAEVRTINKGAGKITLKHGEIKNLDMGAMTMVFQVKDAALLDKVKEGDKVQFTAEKIRGQYTVTAIEKK